MYLWGNDILLSGIGTNYEALFIKFIKAPRRDVSTTLHLVAYMNCEYRLIRHQSSRVVSQTLSATQFNYQEKHSRMNSIVDWWWYQPSCNFRSEAARSFYIKLQRANPWPESKADCSTVVSMQNAASVYIAAIRCCCARLSLCDLRGIARARCCCTLTCCSLGTEQVASLDCCRCCWYWYCEPRSLSVSCVRYSRSSGWLAKSSRRAWILEDGLDVDVVVVVVESDHGGGGVCERDIIAYLW